MNIEETVAMLKKRFPNFGKRELYDTDAKGRQFCEIVLPNEKDPRLPLTVTVFEKGCRISVGQMENVAEDVPAKLVPEVIEDIIEDRIILVFGYRNDEDRNDRKTCYTNIFALTGGNDDMSSDYERFMKKIRTPLGGLKKYMTSLKGIFDICSFSGSVSLTVRRGI